MKIATWNINSVRLRIEIVKDFLIKNDIDILCLQETKTVDETFPTSEFEGIGYSHLHISGQKSYNGVAIISRVPLMMNDKQQFFNEEARHVSSCFEHDGKKHEIHNFYIPAGGDEPDVKINPKFHHKLEYIKQATNWFNQNRSADDHLILVGDFNIAPYENDVWSHKQLLKIVSHTPIEVDHLNNFKASLSFVDIARKFVPESEKLYSWWSYRNRDWQKSNRGRRLDHIWSSKNIAQKVKNFTIQSEVRSLEKPSDHVPVIIEI